MSAMKTTTQAEVDAALLEQFGLKPTGKTTEDKTHQIYEDQDGNGYILPASNEGYSWYSVNDILEHVRKNSMNTNIVSSHNYIAKPDLKIVKPKKKKE